jgi:hypothetical protein
MLMWEYLLREDNKRDLADPRRGREWYYSGKNWSMISLPALVRDQVVSRDAPEWSTSMIEMWERGVRAFRHVVAKRRGEKARKPGLPDATAEQVFHDYLRRLRVMCVRPDDCEAYASPYVSGSIDFTNREAIEAMRLDAWFQSLFRSMVEIRPPQTVCSGCGREMLPTPSGKMPRASLCKACKFRKWSGKQDQDVMRERWSRAQRERRKKNSHRKDK